MDDDLSMPDLRTCGWEHLTRMEGEVSLPDLRLEHLTRIDGDGTGSSTPAPRALQASPAPHSSTNRFQPMTRGGTTGTVRCGETPRSCSTLRTCRQAPSDPPPRWLTWSVSLMLRLNAMPGMLKRFARCVEFAVGVNIVQRLARLDPAL